MRDGAIKDRWPRSVPVVGVGLVLALGMFGAGCGGDDDDGGTGPTDDSGVDTSPGTDSGKDSGTDSTTDSGTDAGDTADTGPLGPGTLGTTTKVANDPTKFTSPFDATLDPTGATVYFTAIAPDGTGAVFSVPAAGGTVTKLASAGALIAPFGIAISTDGKTLFIADVAAGADLGAIYTLPIAGGTPALLAGTDGLTPRSLETSGTDLYFTGIESGGSPALMKIPAAGGTVATVAKGDPFRDPSGLAVTKSGDVYVVDTVGAGSRRANILKVSGGAATEFVSNVVVGYPAGLTLSQDESALELSGLDPVLGTDSVFRIVIATKASTAFTKDIATFTESAGMHRAKNADTYAWVDSTAAGGTVYVLSK